MSPDQLRCTAKAVVDKMKDCNGEVEIVDDYCAELDGVWNVKLAFKGMDHEKRNRTFMYLIRRDMAHADCFASPFFHYGRKEFPLWNTYHKGLFMKVEDILCEMFPNAFRINAFATKVGMKPAVVKPVVVKPVVVKSSEINEYTNKSVVSIWDYLS
jgi:hypothetical protein